MPEPLTTQLVAEVIDELVTVLPPRRDMTDPAKLVEMYRNGLSGLSGDAVRWAVRQVVREDEIFPKIARLRKLAEGWQRTTIAALPHQNGADPMVCHVCGARAESVPVTRYVREARMVNGRLIEGCLVLDDAGRPLEETVMSQGLVMLHDRQRHGVHPGGGSRE